MTAEEFGAIRRSVRGAWLCSTGWSPGVLQCRLRHVAVDSRRRPLPREPSRRIMTASVSSHNHSFIGIDVGGAIFEAAWHRGGCTGIPEPPRCHRRLCCEVKPREADHPASQFLPTGGYEKPLVNALRGVRSPIQLAMRRAARNAPTVLRHRAQPALNPPSTMATHFAGSPHPRPHPDVRAAAWWRDTSSIPSRRPSLRRRSPCGSRASRS